MSTKLPMPPRAATNRATRGAGMGVAAWYGMRITLTQLFALPVVLALSGCGAPSDDSSTSGSGGGTSAATTGGAGGTSSSAATGGEGGASSSAATGGEGGASSSGSGAVPKSEWDWAGIIGTGQSLSVGNKPIISGEQPFNNLMLSLGPQGNAAVPPWNPNNNALSMVPLVEPLRALQTNYPAPYPGNLFGETPHMAMASQITSMYQSAWGGDLITVHTVVGESGQGIVALKKQTGSDTGQTGRAYAATLFEAAAIARLAKDAGKSYGIGAIIMAHGETDSGSSTYKNELIQLLADYNTDLLNITEQTTKIPMFVSQQFAYPQGANQRPVATQVQWELGVEHPDEFLCTGPKYQYPGQGDGVHLSTQGYQQLGEKVGQIYYEKIVLGNNWRPLEPINVTRDGNVITVQFHVPVAPLVWDTNLPAPNAFPNGRGFELRSGNTKHTIQSVEIDGDTVKITSANLPASGLTVGYAMTSGGTKLPTASNAYRWGQLRDSDPFVGYTTRVPQPNYAVAFEMPVP